MNTLYLIMKEAKRQMQKSDKNTSLYLQADFNYTWALYGIKGKVEAHRDILQGKFDLYKAACQREGRPVVRLNIFQ